VHLEAVLIAHLPLAQLAVPAEALQAFRLHLVVELLGRAHFCFRHLGGWGFVSAGSRVGAWRLV